MFAHGSGSSRHSSRNRHVASVLNEAGLATLLFDLLTAEEELNRANVFDIGLLARRLVDVTGWLHDKRDVQGRTVGYFGASAGAAAALWAAAEPDADIAAVVSRCGRPDLAAPRLAPVRSPTLLIVGGHDTMVLGLNRDAQAQLRCDDRKVCFVCSKGSLDMAYPAMVMANAALGKGIETHIFFTFWGLDCHGLGHWLHPIAFHVTLWGPAVRGGELRSRSSKR